MQPHDRYTKRVTPEPRQGLTNSITTLTVEVFFKIPDGLCTQSGKETIMSILTRVPLYLSTAVIKLYMTQTRSIE